MRENKLYKLYIWQVLIFTKKNIFRRQAIYFLFACCAKHPCLDDEWLCPLISEHCLSIVQYLNKSIKSKKWFQPNGQVSVDIHVFNVYFPWALKKKKISCLCCIFFTECGEKYWDPLLKSIVLINIGNSFLFPLYSPLKWCGWGCSLFRILLISLFFNTNILLPKPACLSRACKCALTHLFYAYIYT